MRGKRSQARVRRFMLVFGSVCGAAWLPLAEAQVGVDPGSDEARNSLKFAVGDQFIYDTNLFRLPSNLDSASPTVLSRQDHINTVNLGIDGRWVGWRQQVDLRIRAADNRFARNDSLNNVSGTGKITWYWLVSPRLSGTAGYDFTRVLANFANTFFYSKDLVDTTDYFATGQFRLAQHWTVGAGLKGAETHHSASARGGDQFHSKSGNLGIQYITNSLNSFGFGYAYTDAHFPQLGNLNGVLFDRSYKDSLEQLTVKYQLGGKTELDARAGYLQRRYPDSAFGSFSGNTWHATLTWDATGKTQLLFAGWHELTAYLDAQSDYFVSRGGSVTATWSPTVKIELSAIATFNSLSYISTSPSTADFTARHDNLRSEQLVLAYAPRDWLGLQLSYKYESRDSNRTLAGYIDRVALGQITVRL